MSEQTQLLVGDGERGADMSPCGVYRYGLWRVWDKAKPRAVFVMLNPSTADAQQDDPTIRKCIGFAKRWKCGGIHVVNLFAFRATKPSDLHPEAVDIVGPNNSVHLHYSTARINPIGGPCVVAWGAGATHRKELRRKIQERAQLFLFLADRIPVLIQCLGTAQDGNPRHPLMLAYATELQPYPEPAS